jgi:hypothetical protein
VVAVVLAAAGCTMCCHPYDYCGPVHDDQGCQSCSTRARAGSILGGARELGPVLEEARRPAPAQRVSRASAPRQAQADTKPGYVPGSERIVSVSDRVVQRAATAVDTPQVAAEPSAEPSKPLSANGWTARRPTPDLMR